MRALRYTSAACLAGMVGLASMVPAQAQDVEQHDVPPPASVTEKPTFQGFSDNTASVRYGPSFAEPGIAKSNHPKDGAPIDKVILNFSHFDAHEYWTNFFSIDMLQSNDRDPRQGEAGNKNGALTGATEFYAVYRGNLSGNAITGNNNFAFGPVKDVALEIGTDLNHKNDPFGAQKKLIVIGPNLKFDVPGFFNIGFHFAQEWNTNGIVGKNVTFSPYFQLEPTWLIPLLFTKQPIVFEGFADINSPKGKDGFGAQTVTEVLVHFDIALDIGKVAMDKPNILEGFVGFEYWLNKFGNNNADVPGAVAYSPFVGFRVHF
jgi:nucleoside-specific outer membrane channel protein Tsx